MSQLECEYLFPERNLVVNPFRIRLRVPGPKIESSTNCTPAAIEQFPRSFLSSEQRKQGWLVVHIIIAIYMFVCLSTLCEDYFVPAIEVSATNSVASHLHEDENMKGEGSFSWDRSLR